MEFIEYCNTPSKISFEELAKTDVVQVRELRRLLNKHMGNSPCFMYSSPEDSEKQIMERENNGSRIFIARDSEKVVAFAEISQKAETFVSELDTVYNICGTYCISEYRGKDIYQNLLNYIVSKLKIEGYQYLGVDFESINPTAYAFWMKYFAAYTNSVVRRIDECALHDIS